MPLPVFFCIILLTRGHALQGHPLVGLWPRFLASKGAKVKEPDAIADILSNLALPPDASTLGGHDASYLRNKYSSAVLSQGMLSCLSGSSLIHRRCHVAQSRETAGFCILRPLVMWLLYVPEKITCAGTAAALQAGNAPSYALIIMLDMRAY